MQSANLFAGVLMRLCKSASSCVYFVSQIMVKVMMVHNHWPLANGYAATSRSQLLVLVGYGDDFAMGKHLQYVKYGRGFVGDDSRHRYTTILYSTRLLYYTILYYTVIYCIVLYYVLDVEHWTPLTHNRLVLVSCVLWLCTCKNVEFIQKHKHKQKHLKSEKSLEFFTFSRPPFSSPGLYYWWKVIFFYFIFF